MKPLKHSGTKPVLLSSELPLSLYPSPLWSLSRMKKPNRALLHPSCSGGVLSLLPSDRASQQPHFFRCWAAPHYSRMIPPASNQSLTHMLSASQLILSPFRISIPQDASTPWPPNPSPLLKPPSAHIRASYLEYSPLLSVCILKMTLKCNLHNALPVTLGGPNWALLKVLKTYHFSDSFNKLPITSDIMLIQPPQLQRELPHQEPYLFRPYIFGRMA